MGYLVINGYEGNRSLAVNKDKIIYMELNREEKSLKVVYGLNGGNEQSVKIDGTELEQLETIFNELTK